MKHHRHKQNYLAKKNASPPKKETETSSSKHVVEAYAISTDANGIAKLEDGSIVFVDSLLPGERAQIQIHTKKSTYKRATVLERLTDAPYRTSAPCVYYDRCGGCQLQHIAPAQQIQYKMQWFFETLKRIGKWDEKKIKLAQKNFSIVYLKSHHYRRRVRLHFDGKNLGFREKNSHTITSIETCYIAKEKINEKISFLQKKLFILYPELQKTFSVKSIEFDIEITLGDDERVVINIINFIIPDKVSYDALVKIKTFLNKQLDIEPNQLIQIKHPTAGKIKLKQESFVQPHFNAIETYYFHLHECVSSFLKLYKEKKKYRHSLNSEKLRAWDLYAGSGVFSNIPYVCAQSLELKCETVAVEGVKEAIASLNQTYKDSPIEGFVSDVQDFVDAEFEQFCVQKEEYKTPHIIILDPPRTGAGVAVMQKLVEVCAREACILYLACDPASFARDSYILLEGGFQIRNTILFDAFGQTNHYEVLGFFVKGF